MKNLSQRSQEKVWHPFTQMQISGDPIGVVKGEGVYLYDEAGKKYIDAISSWWTCIHGHAHPYIAQKLYEQATTLEHVIFAGFTHEPAVKLTERLLELLPANQKRVFFSDNGSTAVEVGLKMAFQYWANKDKAKTKIIALKGAYHGDTFGAMSVGTRDAFTEPFFPFLFDVEFVESPAKDAELCIKQIKEIVKDNDVAAFVYEPLVQGSAGMLMYKPKVLNEMIGICQDHDVLCIADEVFTGFNRTESFFASEQCESKPDIICLSKGLTGGVMAMSVTTCTSDIYDAFLSASFMEKTFFHGHSFTANPLACAVANASLDLFEREETKKSLESLKEAQLNFKNQLFKYDSIENARVLGTILAFDFKTEEATGYANPKRDEIKDYFINNGLLIRPLGNTVYILPPYCITTEELQIIYTEVIKFIESKY